MNVSEDGKRKIRDAQNRGHETYKRICLENRIAFIEKYDENPKFCLLCGEKINPFYKNGTKKKDNQLIFCTHSCAARYRNIQRSKFICSVCGDKCYGKNYDKSINAFICYRCKPRGQYIQKTKDVFGNNIVNYEEKLEKFRRGELSDGVARSFFKRITEQKCSICNRTDWNGSPIPLVSDHIDGNHKNNFPDNFRLICHNCDALLPTFKSKNIGNGREKRRNRL